MGNVLAEGTLDITTAVM